MSGIFTTQNQTVDKAPLSICTISQESLGVRCGGVWMAAVASQAWSLANRSILVPFTVTAPFTFSKLAYRTGTAPTGNIDIGVYNSSFARIVSSGSTAVGGASSLINVTVTTTTLVPGQYYFALAADSTSVTIGSSPFSDDAYARGSGLVYRDGTFPLPATMATPVNTNLSASWGVPFLQATSL